MRLRDLGITIGRFPPGPRNSITDVDGVTVGLTRKLLRHRERVEIVAARRKDAPAADSAGGGADHRVDPEAWHAVAVTGRAAGYGRDGASRPRREACGGDPKAGEPAPRGLAGGTSFPLGGGRHRLAGA